MIEPDHDKIAISRQCELLGLSRASYYYESQRDDSYNGLLMNLIDEQFTRTPFYGVLRMTESLKLEGYQVNQKRIRRLMHKMGLEAIYPKKNLSKANPNHKKYPYLLKDVVIDHPDQVWSTDITYIRLQHGFVYLVAIMDWQKPLRPGVGYLHHDGHGFLHQDVGECPEDLQTQRYSIPT